MTDQSNDFAVFVSQSPTTDAPLYVEGFVYIAEPDNRSAIDKFYESTKKIIIEVNQNVDKYNSSEWLGCYSLLAIISATENYIREIIKDIILICPIARLKIKDDKTVRISSTLWNTKEDLVRVLYEDISFASSTTIKSKFKDILDTKALEQAKYNSLFKSFDLVCNLRHSITHADRIIAGKNAVDIFLGEKENRTFLKINANHLNSMLSICTNLVLTINGILFNEMVARWKEKWRNNNLIQVWTPQSQDEEILILDKIYKLFLSQIDSSQNLIEEDKQLTTEQLFQKIKGEDTD